MRSADPEDRRNLYVIAAVMVSLGWTFAPLTAGGADETVDPTRLALLPLSRRQLLGVLFGAAASSPATLAALVRTAGRDRNGGLRSGGTDRDRRLAGHLRRSARTGSARECGAGAGAAVAQGSRHARSWCRVSPA
ncbi:MAG: hypothetical protein R2715_00815 [Ilumatobacteraceae bacterium]